MGHPSLWALLLEVGERGGGGGEEGCSMDVCSLCVEAQCVLSYIVAICSKSGQHTGHVTMHNVSYTHMHTDSPAARTSLKCGDELLAVNGLSLQDATHSEATNILQEVSK